MNKPFAAGERVILRSKKRGAVKASREIRRTFLVELTPGRTLHTHDGVLKHDDVIGRPEGAVIETHLSKPYVAMRPTLVQKMMKLKRRTQIIYPKEAARIILECSIGPGSRVIEIGGGSGALTILMATLVGSAGRVFSFDRNPEFQETAKSNIAACGLDAAVEFGILEAGVPFGLTDIDAVILDLPEPWLAVKPAYDALRPGGHLASITPNAEQLKQLHMAAEDAGFSDLEAREILEREILVRRVEGVRPSERMIGFTGYLLFGRKVP
ncbi:tRNA (adenine-N1)-methyltransferase [bacterium]|nr:tRNA (adenine-N1)-methyltransferase [bacterium]